MQIQTLVFKEWRSAWCLLLLAMLLVIPSTREVHRFLGSAGLVVYAAGVVVALGLLLRLFVPNVRTRVSGSQAAWLAVITVVTLLLLVMIIYPIADSGRIMGGSDRNEAMTAAVGELVHGRYPYTPEGYSGGPITPGPGALVLAIPFVLIGNVAYQSVFWLGIAYLVFRSYLGDGRRALLLLWTFLGLAPVLLQQLVTGSDLVSNALYLLTFMWLLSEYARDRFKGRWLGVISSILLGLGLASRLNYLILVPLIFAMLVRGKGWKEAVSCSLVSATTFAVVTLPFYIYNPAGFSPIHSQHATDVDIPSWIVESLSFLPTATMPVLAIPAGILALALALKFQTSGFRSLMVNCAIVQFILVMPFFILYNYQTHSLKFAFSDIGIAYMIFGALAIWPSLTRAPSDDGLTEPERLPNAPAEMVPAGNQLGLAD